MPIGSDRRRPAALLLNGTVGAGKTTTAAAVSDLLAERRVPHAVIDIDELRRCRPAPPGDPFRFAVALANLRDVCRNHLALGAEYLVLAGVCEDGEQRARHEGAVGVPMTVVRLRVAPETAAARLRRRHATDPAALAWHLDRCGELDAILDRAAVDDHVVSSDASPRQTAARTLRAVGRI
ncbi:AAA family ATPase [Streptomyces lonarensis]|uniref:AAA family ATPase n=1 Tax=Streptomyces lonarensis TaxID=700599 RepID=UPI001ADDD2E5|nr:AAA family ATPase [Streptomyces lonarensis]